MQLYVWSKEGGRLVFTSEKFRTTNLEREFGRWARGDGTERAPEVDGGGKSVGSQQDRSLKKRKKEFKDSALVCKEFKAFFKTRRVPERGMWWPSASACW